MVGRRTILCNGYKCTEMEQKYIIIWMHQYILIYCRLLRGGGNCSMEEFSLVHKLHTQEVDFSLGGNTKRMKRTVDGGVRDGNQARS